MHEVTILMNSREPRVSLSCSNKGSIVALAMQIFSGPNCFLGISQIVRIRVEYISVEHAGGFPARVVYALCTIFICNVVLSLAS